MATAMSFPAVLAEFTAATDSATTSLPNPAVLAPPEGGITLLDAKNEIFLAYLQALALRNLSVIRALRDGGARGVAADSARKLSDDLTRKLVEHRAYLERGVRSLEGKIKYQVDKVVLAAEDAERGAAAAEKAKARGVGNGRTKVGKAGESDEDSDDSDGSNGSDTIAASAHRANAANFARPPSAAEAQGDKRKSREDGVYRPPRVSATTMPTPEGRDRKADRRRPARSATLDEYIATELSSAPAAQPSIGSTIDAGGRRQKDARQLAKEQERRDYEETNLVRLPAESRKERAQMAARERGRGGFGGEEWRGLGDSLDRIGDLTRRGGKKGRESVLDKSRKRTRAVEDGPRGDGMGDAFEARKKRMMARKGRR